MVLPYSLQAIEHIQLLLRCWYSKINLHPIAYPVSSSLIITIMYHHTNIAIGQFTYTKVPSQHNGYDCGVHVMLNIRTLVKVANLT